MNRAMISIIVPVYNNEKYLKRCINSILNQSYENFELILIDDGSSDNSGRICDDCRIQDDRIKVFHKSNGGVSSARNAGLRLAKGDIVCFCDADDTYDIDTLKVVIQFFYKNPLLKIVVSGFSRVKNGAVNKKSFRNEKICSFGMLSNYIFDDRILGSVCNKFFKREILTGELFDENLSLCEDMHFIMKVLTKQRLEKAIIITDCLYNYIYNSDSATTSENRLFNHKNELLYINSMDKIQSECKVGKITKMLLKSQKYNLAAQCYMYFNLDNKKRGYLKDIMRNNIIYYLICTVFSPIKKCKFLLRVLLFTIKSRHNDFTHIL